jgi:hypothetical protein
METMGALFEPEPTRWGLRGDPHLWRALRDHVRDQEIPASPAGVTGLLYAAFCEVVGVDIASYPEQTVYRERFSHGGMSGGMIGIETWRDQLIPLLTDRARLHGTESG